MPKKAAFTQERSSASRQGVEEIEPVLHAIEKIVNAAPEDIRKLLIAFYCRRESLRHIGRVRDWSRRYVDQRLDEANWYVHTELEILGQT